MSSSNDSSDLTTMQSTRYQQILVWRQRVQDASSNDSSDLTTMQPTRYQQLLVWRQRVQDASQLVWMSPENKINFIHYGLDPQELSEERYTFTLQWVLRLIQKSLPSSSKQNVSPATATTAAEQHVLKLFKRYVKRFQKVNLALQHMRKATTTTAESSSESVQRPSLPSFSSSAPQMPSQSPELPNSKSSSDCLHSSWREEFSKMTVIKKNLEDSNNNKEELAESNFLLHVIRQQQPQQAVVNACAVQPTAYAA